MAAEVAYGKIAVVKKDGSEGAHFIILKDLIIGRFVKSLCPHNPNNFLIHQRSKC
jgi:hypothetical protein